MILNILSSNGIISVLFFCLFPENNIAGVRFFARNLPGFPRTFDGHYGLDGRRGRRIPTRDHRRFFSGFFPFAPVHAHLSVRSVNRGTAGYDARSLGFLLDIFPLAPVHTLLSVRSVNRGNSVYNFPFLRISVRILCRRSVKPPSRSKSAARRAI